MAAPKPKTSDQSKRLPKCNGLALDVHCQLADETAAAVDAYHADCCTFERKVSELFGKREKLLAGALDETLRNVIAGGAALNDARRKLEERLTGLRWQRFELLPKLLPEFEKELRASEAAHEKAIADQIADFEAAGVGLAAMPAGNKHSLAAGRQLRHRAMQEVPCLAAFGRLNFAKCQLQGLQAQRHTVPSFDVCQIAWPGAADGITAEIARLAGIA
jgi:hypothetical protein